MRLIELHKSGELLPKELPPGLQRHHRQYPTTKALRDRLHSLDYDLPAVALFGANATLMLQRVVAAEAVVGTEAIAVSKKEIARERQGLPDKVAEALGRPSDLRLRIMLRKSENIIRKYILNEINNGSLVIPGPALRASCLAILQGGGNKQDGQGSAAATPPAGRGQAQEETLGPTKTPPAPPTPSDRPK